MTTKRSSKKTAKIVSVNIRFSAAEHSTIVKAAAHDRRTLNAFVVANAFSAAHKLLQQDLDFRASEKRA